MVCRLSLTAFRGHGKLQLNCNQVQTQLVTSLLMCRTWLKSSLFDQAPICLTPWQACLLLTNWNSNPGFSLRIPTWGVLRVGLPDPPQWRWGVSFTRPYHQLPISTPGENSWGKRRRPRPHHWQCTGSDIIIPAVSRWHCYLFFFKTFYSRS